MKFTRLTLPTPIKPRKNPVEKYSQKYSPQKNYGELDDYDTQAINGLIVHNKLSTIVKMCGGELRYSRRGTPYVVIVCGNWLRLSVCYFFTYQDFKVFYSYGSSRQKSVKFGTIQETVSYIFDLLMYFEEEKERR